MRDHEKNGITSINVTSNQNPNWVLNRNLRVANFHPHILSMHLLLLLLVTCRLWCGNKCTFRQAAWTTCLLCGGTYIRTLFTLRLLSCSWKEGRIRSRILFGSFWILSRWHCFHILCCCDDKGAAGERAGPATAVPDASQNHHHDHHFLYLGCKQKRAAIPVDRANKQFTLVKWFYWAKNRPIHQPWTEYVSTVTTDPHNTPNTDKNTPTSVLAVPVVAILPAPSTQTQWKPRSSLTVVVYPLKSCRAADEKVAKVEESEEEQEEEEEVGK